MGAVSAMLPTKRAKAHWAILCGGLVAGVLDISYAFVVWGWRGRSPLWVLQSVAGGLLGRDTFNRGLGSAALGLVCHFLIALTWAAVYYLASRKLKFMVRQAIVCGLLYGVIIFLFMNFVVLPLSALHITGPRPIGPLVREMIGHMILVGLPIALAVRRFSK